MRVDVLRTTVGGFYAIRIAAPDASGCDHQRMIDDNSNPGALIEGHVGGAASIIEHTAEPTPTDEFLPDCSGPAIHADGARHENSGAAA